MMLSHCCLTRPHVTQGSAQDGQSIEGCHGGALVSLGPPTGTCYGCSGTLGVLCVTFWVSIPKLHEGEGRAELDER